VEMTGPGKSSSGQPRPFVTLLLPRRPR
jgi:hypothetical protein